ncbi:MAG: aminotransferase class I/II-fold pyridoxal phosphate-dependent enzyme, partial [Bacteroidota bacterium]|nr:aminotransferase class I/II-fold pyridoxal phosphate-dependent enzyme [Bacteroidota bacterium]
AAVLREHPHAIAISDEIYEYINFTEAHASLAAQPGMMERTVTVNGVSKGFAMTGWRIGYIAAPKWIAAACTKLQGQFTSGASGISQKATEHAMNGGGALAAEMKAAFLKRRDFMVNGLKAIDGFEVNVPQGAFYIFPDVSALFGRKHAGGALSSGHDLAMYLLEAADVATVGGDAFGSPNCIRLSYAASDEQLAEALRRIERAVGELSA